MEGMKVRHQVIVASAVVALASGCGYSPTIGEYSVGGVVSGLSTTNTEGVLLSDAAGSAVFVSGDGKFSIDNAFPDGAAYDITVSSDVPTPKLKCTVDKGTGTISGSNVGDVTVTCMPATYKIGGTVKGLDAIGLILDNGVESVTLSEDGTFEFETPFLDGASFEVTIDQQPESGKCTMSNQKGTIDGADVTTVLVSCGEDDTDQPSTDTSASP